MNRQAIFSTLLPVLAVLLTTTNLQAQGVGGSSKERHQQHVQSMIEELELDSTTAVTFTEIQNDFFDQVVTAREENAGDRQAMREALMALVEERDTEVEALLTEEQFVKYQDLLAENRKRARKRMGRRKSGNR